MTVHPQPHPLAGQTVTLKSGLFAGETYPIEDWWDRVAGKSWTGCNGNPAFLEYAIRSAAEHTPIDDEVVYGKVGPFGKLIHISQLPTEAANG